MPAPTPVETAANLRAAPSPATSIGTAGLTEKPQAPGVAASGAPAVVDPAPVPLPARAEPLEVVPDRDPVVTLQPTSEPRYALPESLRQFRFPQKNQPDAVLAGKTGPTRPAKKTELAVAAPKAGADVPLAPTETLAVPTVATVNAEGEAPRYLPPDSLKAWRPDRTAPLYDDPEAAPWQASPTEPRLRNAAVSCNYKDEGGVRGKVALLVDDFKVTRFSARIEMPNGGVCQFDSKKMEQRPFEQGIALQSKGDECVVRMWEQKHRITIAAYSCHKQCSKGSFSYLWPILMDTRIGTCY